MQKERWELIYNQINGMLQPDVCEWVKEETCEGGELFSLIEIMLKKKKCRYYLCVP